VRFAAQAVLCVAQAAGRVGDKLSHAGQDRIAEVTRLDFDCKWLIPKTGVARSGDALVAATSVFMLIPFQAETRRTSRNRAAFPTSISNRPTPVGASVLATGDRPTNIASLPVAVGGCVLLIGDAPTRGVTRPMAADCLVLTIGDAPAGIVSLPADVSGSVLTVETRPISLETPKMAVFRVKLNLLTEKPDF